MPVKQMYGGRDLARRKKLRLYGTRGVSPPRIRPVVIKRRPSVQQSKLKVVWRSPTGVAMKKQMKKSGGAKQAWNSSAGRKFKLMLKK